MKEHLGSEKKIDKEDLEKKKLLEKNIQLEKYIFLTI